MRGEGTGVEGNKIELIENRLILSQFYSSLLYYTLPPSPLGACTVQLVQFFPKFIIEPIRIGFSITGTDAHHYGRFSNLQQCDFSQSVSSVLSIWNIYKKIKIRMFFYLITIRSSIILFIWYIIYFYQTNTSLVYYMLYKIYINFFFF